MKISEIAIKRNVMTLMGVLALVLLGTVTVFRIPLNMMPEIDFPFVMIRTILPGAAPDVVETDVTDKIEEAISEVSGIKNLNSTSIENVSMVMIEFEVGQNVDIKAQEVRDQISLIKQELPDDVEDPEVSKFDFNASPVMIVLVSGTKNIADLTDYCDRTLKSRLQSIAGVGRVEIIGGREREIRVWVDPILLEAKNLSVTDVEQALRMNHLEMAGGRIEADGLEYLVKTKGEIDRVSDFENIPVAYRNGSPIRIKEVARVDDGLEELRSQSRLNGENAVALRVYKKSGANIVDIADKVKEKIAQINKLLPEGVNELTITQDMSFFTEISLSQTRNDLMVGGILAVLIILVFLRDWRGTVIAASVIPAAITSSFMLIYWFGFSFNIITLMAYTICVGMLIDDAIVMVEVIFRKLDKGMTPLEAALNGSHEVGFAVVATSFTVMAVFIPVAFTKGIVGQFLFQFGITVCVVVGISTSFALTLTPSFASVLMKPRNTGKRGFFYNAIEKVLNRLESVYRRVLSFAIHKRWVVVVACIFLFIGSILLAAFAVDQEFEPEMDQGELSVSFKFALGTPLEETMKLAGQIEKDLADFDDVEVTFTSVGGGSFAKVNEGSIYVKIVSKTKRGYSQADFVNRLRELFDKKYPDYNIKIVKFDPGNDLKGADIQVALRGPDFNKLQQLSDELISRLKKIDGFVEFDTNYETGKPEIPIYIDREAAAKEGVSVASIAMAINSLVGGSDVTTFKDNGKQYKVRIRLKGEYRNQIEDVYNLSIRSATGRLVALRNLLKPVTVSSGLSEIGRGDRQREIVVGANLVTEKIKMGPASEKIREILWDMGLKIEKDKEGNSGLKKEKIIPDYTAKFVGMVEIMEESFASLGLALVIGIIFIYMVLAAQFNKLLPPFAIMFSLPLSVVGIFTAMWVGNQSLNIMAMISIIMLMGLVAKNAILLIDYTELLRRHGRTRSDAIVEGGAVRLRPILMTALSTIFGMIPAAISRSEGAEMRQTMAICAIGGLITSTFLTLIVIPVAYSLLEDISRIRWVQIISKIFLVLFIVVLGVFVVLQYLVGIDLLAMLSR